MQLFTATAAGIEFVTTLDSSVRWPEPDGRAINEAYQCQCNNLSNIQTDHVKPARPRRRRKEAGPRLYRKGGRGHLQPGGVAITVHDSKVKPAGLK